MITLTQDSYFKFSGGEVHCKVPELIGQTCGTTILMKDYSMDGLMALAEYCEIAYRNKTKIHVIYPYFPYARQDRVMNTDEPFSLRIFCKFLNSLSLASVTVYDSHSDVVSALVHDVKVVAQDKIFTKVVPVKEMIGENVMFVSPDAGAYKKLTKLVAVDNRIAIGCKNRGPAGNIVSTNVYSPVDLSGKKCIVVDDICDGGKTFTELAKSLKAKGATELVLYVTHGIFSKGLDELKECYDRIYTTDSFNQTPDKQLIVKELNYVNL